MGFTSSHLTIALRGIYMGQQWQVARPMRLDGIVFATASAVAVGEAFWNHVKTVWRAAALSSDTGAFRSIYVEEDGGSLSFGEYAIPTGEQNGTRASGGISDRLPSFTAVGVRLTVGSRITRPGQMRIPFLNEGDQLGNDVAPAFMSIAQAIAAVMSAPMVLGAPVATGTLYPQVWSAQGTVPETYVRQDIIGYVVNPVVTTQNSRKQGRGV